MMLPWLWPTYGEFIQFTLKPASGSGLLIIARSGGSMVRNTLIKKARNSKGYWRFIAVHYSSGVTYYVNNFSLDGTLISNRFKSYSEAEQYFNSQTKNGRSTNDKPFIISV